MKNPKIIRPSAAARAFKCHGSVFMAHKIPQGEPSEAAKEGTAFHAAVEAVFRDYLYNHFPLEEAFKLHRDLYWDKEMERHVIETCTEMKKQLEQIGPDKIKKIGLEEKVTLSEELGIGGTDDFAYLVQLEKERVFVSWDHKYGMHAVDVEDNPQLITYACCANATEGWGPFDRAVIHINQPRAEHPEGTLRRVKLSGEEIKDWTERLLELAKTIKKELDNNAPTFNPGEHCKFCAGDGNCQAQLKVAQEAAGVEFLPVEPQKKPELPSPEMLTLEQKQALVLHSKPLEEFLKSVRSAVLREMNIEGVKYPELKLVQAKTKRAWSKDVESVIKVLEDAGMEKPYKQSVCTFAAVTKALGKKSADEILNEWTEKPEGVIQVASINDKRMSIERQIEQAVEEFKDE